MKRGKDVVVMMRCGKTLQFSVTCYEDYEALVREVSGIWLGWVSIGFGATLRKKDIAGIFYIGDGYGKGGESEEACEGCEGCKDDEM